MSNIYKTSEQLIGNTPILELCNIEDELGIKSKLLTKLEFLNPAGSIKDRVANFNYEYKRDENHDFIVDELTGELVKDEEFESTIKEFRIWINSQEEDLQTIFGG